MKKGTPYRNTSAEALHACAQCGMPQPSRTMLLSSRGRICSLCAKEANDKERITAHRRDAAFDAALISALANLPGVGLLLAHSIMEPVRSYRFLTGCVMGFGFALIVFLRVRAIHRVARGSLSARVALGLACSALASCATGIVLFALD